MHSIFSALIFWMGMFLVLSGCAHVDFPYSGGRGEISQADGNMNSVDVSGIGDGVDSQSVIVKRIAFPVDEYAQIKSMGSSTVKGVISLSSGGTRIAGRQTRLYLNPVTSYSNQWYRESYLGDHKMSKSDPRLFNYLKFTASNNSGKFAFYGVPAGNYYIVGTVTCMECGDKKVRIARKVHVKSSSIVTVNLNKSFRGAL